MAKKSVLDEGPVLVDPMGVAGDLAVVDPKKLKDMPSIMRDMEAKSDTTIPDAARKEHEEKVAAAVKHQKDLAEKLKGEDVPESMKTHILVQGVSDAVAEEMVARYKNGEVVKHMGSSWGEPKVERPEAPAAKKEPK